jgi:hypothetical protein
VSVLVLALVAIAGRSLSESEEPVPSTAWDGDSFLYQLVIHGE